MKDGEGMSITQPRDMVDLTAAQFDAFANPVRLRLLRLIAEHGGRLSVSALETKVDSVSQPVIVYHLQRMHKAGILTHEKNGLCTYYALRPEGLSEMTDELDRLLWKHMRALADDRRV